MQIFRTPTLVVIVVALSALGGVGFVFNKDITAKYMQMRERFIARDLHFISNLEFKEFQLKRLGFFRDEPVASPVKERVIDYDRVSGREVILTQSISGDEDVFIKTEDGSWSLLTTDGGIKTRLTLSPDGALAAYSKRSDDESTHFFDPSSWSVYTVDTENGNVTEYKAGFAPQFFTRDGALFLSFLASRQFVTINLDTGRRQVVPLNTFFNGRQVPRVSPDGTLLAIFTPRGGGTYDIHPIESMLPLIIGAPVASLPEGTYLIEFYKDKLYAVRNTEDGITTVLSVMPRNDLLRETVLRETFDTPPAYQLIP